MGYVRGCAAPACALLTALCLVALARAEPPQGAGDERPNSHEQADALAPPQIGPETEGRFPPLAVPQGFKATLFACDPLIEYPSAIARGPRAGAIHVAIDYMTGLGFEIIRRDEIRLVEDVDGDGYADKATLYADGFNSIQGLTFDAGWVYAMHSPLLTALCDTDGDGKADVRRDLLSGLGLPPEENPQRLHCANGVVMGHDGWLYLALGDHGCNVPRREGDRLVLEGGGILRCRTDGRDLHVFATGLRNIYDVALDDELNVFVRDNENDGGDYKVRLCHSFHGADHGYPYLYYERPDEALPPLADLGLGSSAGGACYLETQFPPEYRGDLFFCEWGRSIVRYRPVRSAGGGFAPITEESFASGAADDPYGFKPTDVVVDSDGALVISDWCDGQRPQRGRGRIYSIRYVGDEQAVARPNTTRDHGDELASDESPRTASDWLAQLDSESYHRRTEAQQAIEQMGADGVAALSAALAAGELSARARLHAVWTLAHDSSEASREALFQLAGNDDDPRVQAQAIRALADLYDPIVTERRLDATAAVHAGVAARLAELADGKDPRVAFEAIVAVARLGWRETPEWLHRTLSSLAGVGDAEQLDREAWDAEPWDAAVAHAAMQALRRCENWPDVVSLVDLPSSDRFREVAVRAIADQASPVIVEALIARLDSDDGRRGEYADALARVYKRPAAWTYWGYRPAPRPHNTVAWEATAAIEQALDPLLVDPDRDVRLATLRGVWREAIPTRLATLARCLSEYYDAPSAGVAIDLLGAHPADQIRGLLETVIRDARHDASCRSTALTMWTAGLEEATSRPLLAMAETLEEGPVLAELLQRLCQRKEHAAAPLVAKLLGSPQAEIRAQAAEGLAALEAADWSEPVQRLLEDPAATVRRAAAAAVGRLRVQSACDALLRCAADADPTVRAASLDSLGQLGERRAIPLAVAALDHRETQRAALEVLARLASAEQAEAVIELARREPSLDVVPRAIGLLTQWSLHGETSGSRRHELERSIAKLQGSSGLLVRWRASEPLAKSLATAAAERLTDADSADSSAEGPHAWQTVVAADGEGRVALAARDGSSQLAPRLAAPDEQAVTLAYTDLSMAEAALVELVVACPEQVRVWIDGQMLKENGSPRGSGALSHTFSTTLEQGPHRIVLELRAARAGGDSNNEEREPIAFQASFRRKSSSDEIERLVQAALSRPGNANRGRMLFFDESKTQCSRCHRIGGLGERIGPELTGLGDRFSRVHIAESILEPSRTVATGFQTLSIILTDGRTFTGVKVDERDGSLTLADNQGKKHVLAISAIEMQAAQTKSTMPEGLVKPLTVDQFVDLVAFLASQKKDAAPPLP